MCFVSTNINKKPSNIKLEGLNIKIFICYIVGKTTV